MTAPNPIPVHQQFKSASPVNAMSIDVEDYFQVSAFEDNVARDDWDKWPLRVRANVDRLLEMFSAASVKATFFVLGWVAEKEPAMVRAIVEGGHEIASHGWEHKRVGSHTPATFREDVRRTHSTLEEISNTRVRGYRAASYSVSLDTLWALDVLAEEGYAYSSSICPIRHDHYGIPGFPRFAFRLQEGGILEIPVTTLALGSRNVPCGGGGWFRLAPYAFTRWALKQVNAEQQPAVFYLHPWEIDPHQPRMSGVSARTRFRHYLNLRRTEQRLKRLLGDFRWGRMDQIFGTEIDAKRCA